MIKVTDTCGNIIETNRVDELLDFLHEELKPRGFDAEEIHEEAELIMNLTSTRNHYVFDRGDVVITAECVEL